MRYVIVGNGIVALSIAFRLARRNSPGDSVCIVGESSRVGSATLAAAAMLNSFAEVEVGSLDKDIDRYRFDLSRRATAMWPDFAREILDTAQHNGSDTPSFSPLDEDRPFDVGTYIVNNTAADDLDDENFDAIRRALIDYAEPFSDLSPSDIPDYRPAQRARATRALCIENEGWMNPRQVMYTLEQALRGMQGVSFVEAAALRLAHSNGEIRAVETGDGRIEGDRFLLATGAALTRQLEDSGLDLGVQRVFYGVGVSIEIRTNGKPQERCIRTPNRGLACGVYTAPHSIAADRLSGHVLVGASNFISAEPYHYGRLTSVESLMQAAMTQINTNYYRADLVRVNVGWRPTSQDTYPLLGRTSVPNLVIASGTKRDGFHMAPLLSEKIAAILCGEAVEPEFAAFAPERPVMRTMSRAEAVDKAVRHQLSAAYQHGFTPPTSRMPDQIDRMLRDEVERLHDQVGARDWGIPPEMLDMYRYGHATVSS